jgi:hypothetical protein
LLRWLRRWRERDDRHLVKQAEPWSDLDPIEELARMVGEAQERDADDERRLDHRCRAIEPRLINDGTPIAGSVRDAARSAPTFAKPGLFRCRQPQPAASPLRSPLDLATYRSAGESCPARAAVSGSNYRRERGPRENHADTQPTRSR